MAYVSQSPDDGVDALLAFAAEFDCHARVVVQPRLDLSGEVFRGRESY